MALMRRQRCPPLEAGFSQMHWMRLCSKDEDQTGGVGLADPDSNDCRRWRREEVRLHNTRADAWMVLNNRVYNITPYLRYHPGSIEELMRAAGDDGTALFNEVHPWVNAEAILEACCVGVLAAPAAPPRSAPSAGALHAEEWRPFRLLSRTPASSDCACLRFELDPGRRLGLLVGEHVHVRCERGGKELQRCYTPASALKQEGWFEVVVRRVEGGAVSGWLCGLEPGDTVPMRGPRGFGIYGASGASRVRLPAGPGQSAAPLGVSSVTLVTAGSGITPALALIRTIANLAAAGVPAPSVTFVHASDSLGHVAHLRDVVDCVHVAKGRVHLALHVAPTDGEAELLAQTSPRGGAPSVHVHHGRLDGALLSTWAPDASATAVCCCGPPGFNRMCAAWASEAGYAHHVL